METGISSEPRSAGDVRARIITAATRLIAIGGSDAATTRAVAEAAAVQAPTIYRLFGDKAGLLDAVAEQTLADFVASKAKRGLGPDPVEDLRRGWDDYIAFNLANPAVFLLMTARLDDPSKAAKAGLAVLRERVRRVAIAGRLRVTEERAVDLIHAMGAGIVLTLLKTAPAERASLSEAARDAMLAAVITDQAAPFEAGPASAASALRARLEDVADLSPGERQLLDEWLERIARLGRYESRKRARPARAKSR